MILWAQLSTEGFLLGVAGVITAIAAATAGVISALNKAKLEREKAREGAMVTEANIERQENIDEEDRLARVADRLEKDIAEQKAEIEECKKENLGLRDQVHKLRDKHNVDIGKLMVDLAKCQVTCAEQRGEIRLLQSSMQRLQTKVGAEAPGATVPVVIVAEMDGTIREVSPAAGPVLEWLAGELIGKNVEVIIPEDLREKHREALKRIRDTGDPPWTERVLLTEALTKNGERLKVSVRVKAWQSGVGHWMLSGEISPRESEEKEKVKVTTTGDK